MGSEKIWDDLRSEQRRLSQVHLRELFADDAQRFERFSLAVDDLWVDFSKTHLDQAALHNLLELARSREVEGWRERMFRGDAINTTEKRAVLHTALRTPAGAPSELDPEILREVQRVLQSMRDFVTSVHEGRWRGFRGETIRDVVHIGIGGSDLGPRMVVEALKAYRRPELRVHFVSNVDGAHIEETLRGLDASRTLFIIASKTFRTLETLANARWARSWFLEQGGSEADIRQHFVALSTNHSEVAAFGIDPRNTFEFWDWVGGRYSLWSAIGLPIALALGFENFQALLGGAHRMDQHFRKAPLEANLPVILALIGIWYRNLWGAETQAVIPYDQNLNLLPAYLQQLDMESNGKLVTRRGEAVDKATGPIVWGQPGTDGQHAFFQLLHQGSALVPCDFWLSATSPYDAEMHRMLAANCLAQSEALMYGKSAEKVREEMRGRGMEEEAIAALLPHRIFPGNRPSTTLLYPCLDPATLGSLLALYEHKVFVMGVIWDINSFDQWGVELGKELASEIIGILAGDEGKLAQHDASTRGLIHQYRQKGGY